MRCGGFKYNFMTFNRRWTLKNTLCLCYRMRGDADETRLNHSGIGFLWRVPWGGYSESLASSNRTTLLPPKGDIVMRSKMRQWSASKPRIGLGRHPTNCRLQTEAKYYKTEQPIINNSPMMSFSPRNMLNNMNSRDYRNGIVWRYPRAIERTHRYIYTANHILISSHLHLLWLIEAMPTSWPSIRDNRESSQSD